MIPKTNSWVAEEAARVALDFEEKPKKEGLVASGAATPRWRTGGGRRRCSVKTLNTWNEKRRKHVVLLQIVSCIFFLLYILKPFLPSLILNNNTPLIFLSNFPKNSNQESSFLIFQQKPISAFLDFYVRTKVEEEFSL